MKENKMIDMLAGWLVVIGGLNWLLIGLFEYNLVFELFGNDFLAKLIYIVVGVAAVWMLVKMATAKKAA